MKVKELIELLSKHDGEVEVFIRLYNMSRYLESKDFEIIKYKDNAYLTDVNTKEVGLQCYTEEEKKNECG